MQGIKGILEIKRRDLFTLYPIFFYPLHPTCPVRVYPCKKTSWFDGF
jgi:hypothetical protein